MEKENNIQQFLDNKGRENPFIVPQHYFDDFPALMQEKLVSKQKHAIRVYLPRLVYTGVFAAFILVIAVTLFHVLNPDQPDPYQLSADGISLYASNLSSEYDEELITQLLAENYSDETDDLENLIQEDDFYDLPDNHK